MRRERTGSSGRRCARWHRWRSWWRWPRRSRLRAGAPWTSPWRRASDGGSASSARRTACPCARRARRSRPTCSVTRSGTRYSRCSSRRAAATSGRRSRSGSPSVTARIRAESATAPLVVGTAGHQPARGRAPGRRTALPRVRRDPRSDAVHASAVQHLDRVHLRPEPAGHPRLRPRHRRPRVSAGRPDDRRGVVRGLRRLGVPSRPLSRSEGDDARAPRHGLQGHGVGLPVHPGRRPAVRGALPRHRPHGVAAECRRSLRAGARALVGRLQRGDRLHQPAGLCLVPRAAAAPRRHLRGRRLQVRRRRRGALRAARAPGHGPRRTTGRPRRTGSPRPTPGSGSSSR